MGNDRAMANVLPVSKISPPEPGNLALRTGSAASWLLEQQGERQPLQDNGHGPACLERARLTRILVVEDPVGLQLALRTTNYLRFHMVQLRRKLEDNPARPRHLLTERGMGYRYQPLAAPGA
jgi:Transcriptional regulatory protein, C terminal